MRFARSVALLLPLATGSGCVLPNGEFENGSFYYECTGPTDATCSFVGAGADRSETIPPTGISVPPVAVGAGFALRYDDLSGAGGVSLEPASSQVLRRASDGFTALLPGATTVLARGAGGNIVDMLQLDARPVADLLVFPMRRARRQWGTPDLLPPLDGLPVRGVVTVPCGACTAILFVAPTADNGTILGGALEYRWSVAPEGVVRIAGGTTGSTATLEAIAVGGATLRIDAGGFVKELPVRVEE